MVVFIRGSVPSDMALQLTCAGSRIKGNVASIQTPLACKLARGRGDTGREILRLDSGSSPDRPGMNVPVNSSNNAHVEFRERQQEL